MRIAPWIIGEIGEGPGDLDVLTDSVRPKPPVALAGVFLPQSLRVERHVLVLHG